MLLNKACQSDEGPDSTQHSFYNKRCIGSMWLLPDAHLTECLTHGVVALTISLKTNQLSQCNPAGARSCFTHVSLKF